MNTNVLKLLTAKQTAERAGCHRATIDRLVRIGQFPAPIYLGVRSPRWPETVIADFLASRREG